MWTVMILMSKFYLSTKSEIPSALVRKSVSRCAARRHNHFARRRAKIQVYLHTNVGKDRQHRKILKNVGKSIESWCAPWGFLCSGKCAVRCATRIVVFCKVRRQIFEFAERCAVGTHIFWKVSCQSWCCLLFCEFGKFVFNIPGIWCTLWIMCVKFGDLPFHISRIWNPFLTFCLLDLSIFLLFKLLVFGAP